MTSKIFKRVMLLTAISLLFSIDMFAALNGRWIQHPAATLRSATKESQVDRIIDGKKYVYFSVRGGAFDRSKEYLYSTKESDPLTLFRYDKSLPWEDGCIRPVAQEVELAGAFHQALEYSPKRGVLALAFEDGAVDFIYDNGNHVKSNALVGFSSPGRQIKPYSITFDEEKPLIYLAGTHGVAAINIENGELEALNTFDSPVAFAARVGENMVIVAGSISPTTYNTATYVVPASNIPRILPSPIKEGENLQAIMPLTDDSFAALARGTGETNNILKVYTIKETGVEAQTLVASITVEDSDNTNYRHLFRTDGMVGATEDGFAVQGNADIIFIRKGADTSADGYNDKVISTIAKASTPNTENTEKSAKAATFDGKDVWFYYYDSNGLDASKRGFYKRTYSDGQWSEPSVTIEPSGPKNSYPLYGQWNPEYGMLFRGPGSDFKDDYGTQEDDYFFGYKDGEWTDLTYNANNTKYRPLTVKSKYVATDPLNPAHVWGLSHLLGLHRMDLSDYTNFFMASTKGHPAGNVNTYPGFYRCMDEDPCISTLINGSNIDFDNEGRLWFARYYVNTQDYTYIDEYKYSKILLYYYTKKDREDFAAIQGEPHVIAIPHVDFYQVSRLIALKNDKNQNMIAAVRLHMANDVGRPFLFDHKGTPDIPNDDRLVYIENIYDENGEKFSYIAFRGLFEDPESGDLWVCTNNGPILLNPQEIIEGNMKGRRPKITKRDGMEVNENPFNEVPVRHMDIDRLNRKWFATEQGLFCLSQDGTELLCKYDKDNSPLPSDNINSVACDKTTGAVFVMTDKGMVEFQPEDCKAEIAAGSHLTIWPQMVAPDYKGYINISGAQEGASYIVRNASGDKVINLGKPKGGMLQWDGCDESGVKVAAGKYNIMRDKVEETNTVKIL